MIVDPGAGQVGSCPVRRTVGDVDVFATEYWGRRPLVRRGTESFVDLLDVAAVESLLTDLGRRPTFRVVKAGTVIDPSEYTKRARVGGVAIDDVADVDRVLALVAGGATVVLQGLHRTWPPLSEFCADFARVASHHVQANAYLSPPHAAGLGSHRDLHDVVVIQVGGEKYWDVEGLADVTLKAGDTLYIPARTQHVARSVEEYSLHLTIGVVATTRRQLLHQVVDQLSSELDTALPFGYGSMSAGDALETELAEMLEAVADELADVDPQAVARQQVARQSKRRSRRIVGRLASVVDPGQIDDHTRLRRRCRIDMTLSSDEGGTEVTVEFDGCRLHLPGRAAPALDIVASRRTLAVGDLTGLDMASRAVLARRLVREGLLEIVGADVTADQG